MSYASEAETCGTFNNRKPDIVIQPSLIALDHKKNSNTSQNGKFYDRRIFKLGDETKTFNNMEYEVALVERQRVT